MLNQRNKVFLAVAGSLGLHVLLLLLWAVAAAWFSPVQANPTRAPQTIKLTIEEEKKPEFSLAPAAPTPTPASRLLNSEDMAETATPPPDAKFQSARNTTDASELPPEGDEPRPTQRGRKVPEFVWNTTDYTPESADGKATPGDPVPAPVDTAPPLPRAVPPPNRAAPAAVAPAATPPPPAGDFAFAAPGSIPTEPAVEANPYDPSVRTPSSLTEPPRPTPAYVNSRRSGYQPQQLKTATSGSITNRGAASIASSATPLGRYQNTVTDVIRRRWYAYVDKRADLASMGSVKIHFLVGLDGRARGTQIVTNTANDALASISLQAILDARFPPMPPDAVPGTGGGQLPMDLTFEFIDSGSF